MIYNKDDKVKYRGLSRDELHLISRAEFEKCKFITTDFVRAVFNDSKKSYNILDRLTRKGRLIQIEKGKYFIVPIKAPNQLWSPNEFIVAKFWMGEVPYYIGYFTMYSYWGFTDQIPQTVFILNTKKSREKVIAGVNYKAVKIKGEKYYGIKKIKVGGEDVNISDKERTLVDFIYRPQGTSGNVREVIKDNIEGIDQSKFVRYLNRFPVNAVRRRAGYMLEGLGYPKNLLEKIKRNIGKRGSYVVLNSDNPSRKGKVDKEWGVIING